MNFVFRALSVKMFQASLFGIRTEEFSRKQATDSLNKARSQGPLSQHLKRNEEYEAKDPSHP